MHSIKVLRGYLLLIFLLALSVRLLVLVFRYDSPLPPDGEDYQRLAVSLSERYGYVNSSGQPTSARPPFYAIFLSVIFALAKQGVLAAKIIQALMDAATCMLIYLMTKKVYGQNVAWISGIFSTFHLSFVFASTILLPETLLTFLIVVAMFYLLRVLDHSSVMDKVILGAVLGAAALTRGTLLIFPLFMLIPFLFSQERKFFLKQWIGVFLFFFVTIAPWMIRNYWVHHQLIPVTTQMGHVFYSSYKPPEGKIFGVYTVDDTVTYARSSLSEAEASSFLFQETLRYIADNPTILWYLSLLKLAYFISPFDWEILGGNGIYNFTFAFVFPLSFWGMWISVRGIGRNVLFLPILHSLFVSLLFYGSPRLRLSVEPFFIIFAAVALSSIFNQRGYKMEAVGATVGSYFVISLGFYFFSSDVKAFLAGLFQTLGLW